MALRYTLRTFTINPLLCCCLFTFRTLIAPPIMDGWHGRIIIPHPLCSWLVGQVGSFELPSLIYKPLPELVRHGWLVSLSNLFGYPLFPDSG